MIYTFEYIYRSPDDDVENAFVSFLNDAKREILFNVYSYHLPRVQEILLAKIAAGVVVRGVFDHTQARGHYEAPDLTALLKAGADVTIATSPIDHQLDHEKVAIRDPDDDNRAVWFGSWNFTTSASKQRNVAIVTNRPDVVASLRQEWQASHDWARANEKSYQLGE